MELDKVLLNKIRNNALTLTSLRLKEIGDTATKDLSDALKHNTTLTSLPLTHNQIGAVGAKDLSDALKHNTTLTSLNLAFNKIGDTGAKYLSDALKHNTTLTTLLLINNQIGAVGAKGLSDALKHNTALTALDLGINQIGTAGAKDLSDALKHNATLTSLRLLSNQIGDAGAKDLSDALKHNATLTSLDLQGNEIRDAGAKDLSDALKHNTTLISFDLRGNENSAAQLQEMGTLIQRNKQMMLARRQQFLYKLIILARNARNPNPDSLWTKLPKEIRFHILSFVNLCGKAHINKTAKKIEQCTQFIFANIDECSALIKAKQRIKLLGNEDTNGNYQLRFFKPPAFYNSEDPHKIHITQQRNTGKRSECDAPSVAVIPNVSLECGQDLARARKQNRKGNDTV